jgi:heat shock protein HtpX
MALSRSREFMADAGSVELTKDPDAMISALRRIENRGELPGATSAVMEMCVDNPREGFADLFATHPSIEARVRALVTYAGGRDPGPMRHLQHERDTADTNPTDEQDVPPGPWGEPAKPAAAPPPAPSPWGDHS